MKWQWLGKSWYAIIFGIGFILLGIVYIREYVNNVGKHGVQIMLIGGSVLIIAGFIQLVYAVAHKLLGIYTQRKDDRTSKTGRADTRD